tara:strand:+ start:335 stop:1186 length:852 start_codon:yes stop_codon:yes gene_type:complete
MPYIGPNPAESFTSFATQEFSTSATTSYTLDHAVANENEIALFINNVRQQPGSGKAYTATGTALTLSAATASTDTMYCVFLGRALQTVNPATNSISTAMISDNAVTAAKISASLGKIIQVVSGTDNTQYELTSTSATTDQAGSTAFSITPSATSSKIMLNFQIGQVMSKDGSGIRMRIYRQINGGGYSHVTALSGAASGSNRPAAFAGNFGSHTDSEDENRTRTIGGHCVDSPNTTSQVDYKLYFGQGDTGTRYIYVNRTRGTDDSVYRNQTLTHVTLFEIGA